ncbi:hypothetical protein [Streptomyces sp. A012304]|uniref:hypothetical protein n=1 Tax=Streptomyces sp. A012304 TaxID=375446 RepID=UPI00222FA406|nr:hypothetical protein [Streptomyces sp. A012304]GKQ36056.1 hypothetical protein ALMP_25990 [Streptomyces sp. A012304]
MLSAWGAAAGAFVGTLALTTALRAASELGMTRMDLPFMLGAAVTVDRTRAKAIGYLMHFLNGQIFAFLYFAVFLAIDRGGWWLGALFGLAHGLFAGTALVNVLLPLVHPRMGSSLTSAPESALLEPPGFLMRNYGPSTPLVTVLAHVGYGAIVGGFTSLGV